MSGEVVLSQIPVQRIPRLLPPSWEAAQFHYEIRKLALFLGLRKQKACEIIIVTLISFYVLLLRIGGLEGVHFSPPALADRLFLRRKSNNGRLISRSHGCLKLFQPCLWIGGRKSRMCC